jgi:3-oxoacyl-[acyl-carrier protein] reductase
MEHPSIPDLRNKVYLVTGASTGIGAAVALALGEQKARVAVHYHSSEAEAREVAASIRSSGAEAHLVRGDLTKHSDVGAVVEQTAAHFGHIDGLINNAGTMFDRRNIVDFDESYVDKVLSLNAMSVIWACHAAVPLLKRSGGVVINTTSVAARTGGGAGGALYAASKAFVSNFTRALAKEVVTDQVRVNAVSPGVILTPLHDRYTPQERMKEFVSAIPMGRAGTPEDCVGAFLFLASNLMSGYLTG